MEPLSDASSAESLVLFRFSLPLVESGAEVEFGVFVGVVTSGDTEPAGCSGEGGSSFLAMVYLMVTFFAPFCFEEAAGRPADSGLTET